jgi:hypothetical protein
MHSEKLTHPHSLFIGVPNEGVEKIDGMRYVEIERTRVVSHYDRLAILH